MANVLNSVAIYTIIAIAFGWLYMQNEYKSNEIVRLKSDMENQRVYFDRKIKTEVFNAVVAEKKRAIVGGLKYDKNSSVSIDSTRFYLK